MRILHVVPSYYPAIRYGGPIRSVHGLAAAQASNGHCVDVFTTNIDGDSNLDVPLDRPVYKDGVRVHYFPVSRLRRLCVAPQMTAALKSQLLGTDVVHLHSVYLWPTYVAARESRRAGVPYMVAPRGMLVRSLIEQKSTIAKRIWIRAVERKTLSQAAGIHVTTETEREDLRQLGLTLSETYCVPNGVTVPEEIKPFSRFDAEIGISPFVLYVGRLNWKKGIDRLVRAWSKIPLGYRLVIAGNDEDGYRNLLERLIEDLQLRNRIVLLGEVADDEKWELYQRARLFVLPSISENFGNVVLEAMAMGCPVLVSTGVGLADVVRANRCGVVCSNDPDVLASEMSALLCGSAISEMGKRGKGAVRDQYSWDAIAGKMDDAYRVMLSRANVMSGVIA